MSPRKNKNSASPVRVADRLGALPDSILNHMLSFLPVQAAARTCVLALDDEEKLNVTHLRKFVDHLLILREHTDLHTVEIKFDEFYDDDQTYVNLWTRFAVMHKVRALTLRVGGTEYLYLDNFRLVSRHLKTLDLAGVDLQEIFLDFASCPALEDLKMKYCVVDAGRISFRSLKHLSISGCRFNLETPFLENMALLETAYVNLDEDCIDACLHYYNGVYCGANKNACADCRPIEDDRSSNCVLLGGLTSAKHLKLLSESRMFIFTRDLKYCPTFSNLKTLLLNEYWCEAPDLDPLARILKNSPVLEKLTLQLFSTGPIHKVEMEGSYSSMEAPSAIS